MKKTIAVVSVAILAVAVFAFFVGKHSCKCPVNPVAPRIPIEVVHTAPAVAQPTLYEYDVDPGDTFSQEVYELYGDGRKDVYMTAAYFVAGLRDAADPDHIYPGDVLFFPDTLRVGERILTADITKVQQRRQRNHVAAHAHVATGMISTSVIRVPAAPKVTPDSTPFAFSRFTVFFEVQPSPPPDKTDVAIAEEAPLPKPRFSRKPSRFKVFLAEVGNDLLRGGLGTIAGGPIMGIIAGAGPPAAKLTIYGFRHIKKRRHRYEEARLRPRSAASLPVASVSLR